jgi:hypothetical protein
VGRTSLDPRYVTRDFFKFEKAPGDKDNFFGNYPKTNLETLMRPV